MDITQVKHLPETLKQTFIPDPPTVSEDTSYSGSGTKFMVHGGSYNSLKWFKNAETGTIDFIEPFYNFILVEDATHPFIAVVVFDIVNQVFTVRQGTPAAIPVPPTVGVNEIQVQEIRVETSGTTTTTPPVTVICNYDVMIYEIADLAVAMKLGKPK